ncbi:hypothetical protein KUTeg_022244 [Tegillarca granosa]|uniref:Uncharacterized protein n=2 Tax=Tegillarca granosa TaxID=220873 RepID=A0ABQ9E6G1_TEGGR|nr:hypothetical protein KUTeg_022244 [Tegillarca granosa]
MKQLEEEKNILLTGLDIVDKARDWYHKQVVHVEEKQKYVGKTSYNDSNLESYQERMNFQKARVNEVNQQLKTLMESTEKGFPLHMNLAMRSSTNADESTVKMLKDQNRQLTQEISQKSDKIAQLEQEKSSLIRDLFDARAKNKNYDDTTFM